MIDPPDKKDPRPSQPPPAARKAAERDARLKAQLKVNLARRKNQARARREGAEDSRAGDLIVPAMPASVQPVEVGSSTVGPVDGKPVDDKPGDD